MGLPFASKPVFAAVVCDGAFVPGTAWFEATPPGCAGGALAVGAAAFGAELASGAAPAGGCPPSPRPGHSPGPDGGSGGPARPQPASPNATAASNAAAKQTRKRSCAKEFSQLA